MLMRLIVTHRAKEMLINHAKADYPQEACGLLAGRGDMIMQIIPIENSALNPQSYFIISQHHINQYLPKLREERLNLLGFYHSHPNAKPIPSTIDVRELDNGMNLPHLLIGIYPHEAELAVWQIAGGRVDAIELIFNDIPLEKAPDTHTRTQTIAILLSMILSLVMLIGLAVLLLPPAPRLP